MSMHTGNNQGIRADMNITPMIDVLLVLIVIFMLITPLAQKGINAEVPQPRNTPAKSKTDEQAIVIQVLYRDELSTTVKINQEEVTWDALEIRLRDIYKMRADKAMFIRADGKVEYERVVRVMDIARKAEPAIRVGLVTTRLQETGG